jgi:hypothetical protein
MTHEDRAREATTMAQEAVRIVGKELQAAPNFTPNLITQIALGRAGETIARMIDEYLDARDQLLAKKIQSVLEDGEES